MTTKLEIIGPYTPEHEGPFCLDNEPCTPVELKIRDGRGEYPLAGYIGCYNILRQWRADGGNCTHGDLMNAREVPVAREFWVNDYTTNVKRFAHSSLAVAESNRRRDGTFIRTIHVREVLPGDGE
ncbi:hypothetical protein HK16_09670 [Acetobacter senegalensis]|uniref:Uncharacterized protein n=2 Tax=Acetobacter TaxID=434 RepID=A0A252EMS7_9PROT|nr:MULTISPECIES: hypothetical protein [Acetobacter]ATJ90411.1 hypothetical protein CIW82_06655 [Acetobacter tropicalis]OUL67573.1 hypothetical protein HK16_09670 [Acetobacter senegalensis]